MSKSIDNLIRAGFGLALLILVVISALSYRSVSALIDTSHWVEHSHAVIEALDDLNLQITDVESAARAFVVAGEDFYLDPYYEAAREVDQTILTLRKLTADNPRQRQRLAAIEPVIRQKLSYHRSTIDLRKESGLRASTVALMTGQGHRLMDQIRDATAQIGSAEKRLLTERVSEARSRGVKSLQALVAGALLSLSMLVFVYFHLNREIGRRRRSEAGLIRLNRLYAVLSRVSEASVRIRDRAQLLNEVCRIAVEDGGFRMCWIGFADDSGHVRPVAQHGADDGYLEGIQITMGDEPEGRGPTGSALREGGHFVSNDIGTDERMLPWRQDALRRGYRSSAAFPVRLGDRVSGVFTVYGSESGLFDEEKIGLLEEVAAGLGLALEGMEQEAQRYQAEQALAESETRFRQMAENIAEMFWITDGTLSKMLYVSPAYEQISGLPCQNLYDDPLSFLKLIHPEERDRIGQGIEKALETGVWNAEYRIVRADGSVRWVWDRAFPVREASGAVFRFVGITQDITERKQAEEAIRQLNQNLERRVSARTAELAAANRQLAEKNGDVERATRLKSEFLARMSHELRTPMNAIVGFSELLGEEADGPLTPRYREYVEHIRAGSAHLLELIKDVLDLSKIEAGRIELHPRQLNVAAAVAEVLAVIRPLVEAKELRIDRNIPAGLEVSADPIRFKQVLFNLLSNAVKFTPDQGRVSVAAGIEGEWMSFSVTDTGVGIPAAEHTAIFDEFYQVGTTSKGVKEGTGLGLAITRKLLELHGGSIRVESEPGKGSRFTFTIPASGESLGDTEEAAYAQDTHCGR